MTKKQRVTEKEMVQADGATDDQTVTADADVAEPVEVASEAEVGAGDLPRGGLPMEPTDQRVARLESELESQRERMLRLAAEFDNYKKRIARERVELADRAQAAFVLRMLDVLDDLDRLVAGENSAHQSGPLYDATVMINRKLRKELEASGLERIDPTGQPFDPARHEAVSTTPASSPDQDHTVSATFQSGYAFKGNLIRPARVQVFTNQDAE